MQALVAADAAHHPGADTEQLGYRSVDHRQVYIRRFDLHAGKAPGLVDSCPNLGQLEGRGMLRTKPPKPGLQLGYLPITATIAHSLGMAVEGFTPSLGNPHPL